MAQDSKTGAYYTPSNVPAASAPEDPTKVKIAGISGAQFVQYPARGVGLYPYELHNIEQLNPFNDAMFLAFRQIVNDGITYGLTYPRNLFVNPAMMVHQGIASFMAADMWGTAHAGTVAYTRFHAWNYSFPAPSGNPYRARVQVTTADAAVAADDFFLFYQVIEASRMRGLRWGTTGALKLLLRFTIRAPMAGTFYVSVRSFNGGTRSYLAPFAIAAGDVGVDKVVSISVPGDTHSDWSSFAHEAMALSFSICLMAGTTYQGTPSVWSGGTNKLGAAGMTNGMGATGTWEFTDFQAYPDYQGQGIYPPYEIPELGAALRECQRYLQKSYDTYTLPGAVTTNGRVLFTSVAGSWYNLRFGVTMRAAPTIAYWAPTSGTAGVAYNYSTGANGAAFTSMEGSETGINYAHTVAAGNVMGFHYTANASGM